MAGSERTKVTKEELYDLLDKYKEYVEGKITIFDFLGLSSSSSDEEIRRRCKQIRRLVHQESWVGCPDEYSLASEYSSNINSLLDCFKTNGVGNGYSYEDSSNNYYSKYFIIDREHKIERLRKLLEKDPDFEYNGLDSLIEHYIKSTIKYISSMNISQRAELVRAYSSVLELIRLEYIKFYDEFVLGNLIVVNKIGYKDRITFNESLEEFAIKLRSIKSNYSLSVILTEKLEMKLSGKMKYSNDIRYIEQFLKNCISEIANRGLSIEEANIGFSTIIASRCCEFDDICTSSIVSYRKIKRTVSDLTSGYRVLKSLCKEGEILSKIDGLFNELEKSLTMISSFDLVLKKVDEVTKMLEAIKFKGRVAPKIDRYYNTVIRNESRKCRDADKKAYWDFVSSSLLKIYNSWTSNLYLAADLLVELFSEIDVNDREKTDRILSFLNYSTSGIFVRRKESSPSNSDSFGFYILEQAGLNRYSFSIYQINSKGKVKSCPINSSELFQLYLPLEEVVFLKLKYCFRTSDFDGSVLGDESGGYFLLNSDDSYDISVGENGYSYNIIDVLSINGINRYDMFTSICDFVRKRFREHKNKTDYYRR